MSIPPRDYMVRTSPVYDDRDGDVVTSLSQPLIKSCDSARPKMVFFLVPEGDDKASSVPTLNLNVEGYARMADIPEPLRSQVREALGLKKKD